MSNSTRKSRDQMTRTKSYRPPAMLDAPKAPEGLEYRWVRVTNRNVDDAKNISAKRRDGWEPVRAEEHADFGAPAHEEGKYAGCIGVGDLVLMKNDAGMVESRREYYQQRTERQLVAVDNDLMKEQNAVMPIIREHKTTTSGGTRRVEFDE